jgi:uncharacterized protein YqeY
MALKARIQSDMKDAMRAGEKERLSTIRMLLAAIKQREVDERIELDDAATLQIIEKQIKQRREAASQFAQASRPELESKELAEAELLAVYLPEPLDDDALQSMIDSVIQASGATGIRDMGKVMNALREQAQGRADMGKVSQLVKARLAG